MTYEEIVESTYIKPIRSVVAVDDEFPTLDRLYADLNLELNIPTAGLPSLAVAESRASQPTADASIGTEPQQEVAAAQSIDAERDISIRLTAKETVRAGEIIAYCRKAEWLVDIHDGSQIFHDKGDDGEIIRHLHQTDLLILDYQLKGEAQGGESSIRILRGLARNPRFNIVVVYTKKDISEAFREISLGLLQRVNLVQDATQATTIGDVWDDWGDAYPVEIAKFEELIDISGYLNWRSAGAKETNAEFRKAFSLVASLGSFAGPKLAELIPDRRFTVDDLVRWHVNRFEAQSAEAFDTNGLSGIDTKAPRADGANWVHSENLFVTIIPKRVEGGNIVGELKRALVDWRPAPHQLILSQMRAELEVSGGAIEQKALEDQRVQAGLLWQMLESEEHTRRAMVSNVLDRQWSEVWLAMRDKIVSTSDDLLNTVLSSGETRLQITSKYYPASFVDSPPPANSDVWVHLNSYWSTEPVNGRHLTTGHIFELAGFYWICVSPSCDMVPEQGRTQRWRGRMGGELAFKAVKLAEAHDYADGEATKGLCVYLRLGGDIKVFRFIDSSGGEDANPDWEQMIVLNNGLFKDHHEISIRRISKSNDVLSLTEAVEVTVIGQLRYEYALNLLQRLGQNLSRIGLGYMKPN